jgi:hypothetical protein
VDILTLKPYKDWDHAAHAKVLISARRAMGLHESIGAYLRDQFPGFRKYPDTRHAGKKGYIDALNGIRVSQGMKALTADMAKGRFGV